jgi:hypothetical protein
MNTILTARDNNKLKRNMCFCVVEHTNMFVLCYLDRLSLVYKLITKTKQHESKCTLLKR